MKKSKPSVISAQPITSSRLQTHKANENETKLGFSSGQTSNKGNTRNMVIEIKEQTLDQIDNRFVISPITITRQHSFASQGDDVNFEYFSESKQDGQDNFLDNESIAIECSEKQDSQDINQFIDESDSDIIADLNEDSDIVYKFEMLDLTPDIQDARNRLFNFPEPMEMKCDVEGLDPLNELAPLEIEESWAVDIGAPILPVFRHKIYLTSRPIFKGAIQQERSCFDQIREAESLVESSQSDNQLFEKRVTVETYATEGGQSEQYYESVTEQVAAKVVKEAESGDKPVGMTWSVTKHTIEAKDVDGINTITNGGEEGSSTKVFMITKPAGNNNMTINTTTTTTIISQGIIEESQTAQIEKIIQESAEIEYDEEY